MHIVTVTGAGSGVGKTTLSGILLKKLPGFAAVKVSVKGMYCSVTDDPSVVMQEGKDTRVMADAGAKPVVLVTCPGTGLADAMDQALVLTGNARGVLVEGNSASARLDTDVSFYVTGPDVMDAKESAGFALMHADVVVVNVEDDLPSASTVEAVRKFNRLAAIATMGALMRGSPELDELVAKLA